MDTQRLTDYELKRFENIKRNGDLLASLKIKSKLAELSASSNRHRAKTKSYKILPRKKPRSEAPIVTRRSLRAQGKSPDELRLKKTINKSKTLESQTNPTHTSKELVSLSMKDAKTCSHPDETLVNRILSVCKQSRLDDDDKKCRVRASVDLESMELAPENIASVVPDRIYSVKFFPSAVLRMVTVGNNFGHLGFWNVDSDNEDGDGIYLYQPHSAPVSAILIHPFSLNKIITSCYGGLVRSLDIEKETFGLVYSSEHAIYSMCQQPDDVNSLYLGEGDGVVSIWDERSATSLFTWELHDSRINTIDFNPENTNMMATSSSDRTACIWDLRKLGESKPKSLKVITRNKPIHSAYFSPSGGLLATTSHDKIGVLSGANYEDEFFISHNTQASWFCEINRGVWGWDDSYIFVRNRRGVDVIATEQKGLVTTLESPHVTAILCRFDSHPFIPGMLAGATLSGHVYIWT